MNRVDEADSTDTDNTDNTGDAARRDGRDDRPTVGVVVMAYGTPSSSDKIEEYYTDIRRGNPPLPEALAELTARYDAIGGISPLAQRTSAQATAIQTALDELAPGRYSVTIGLKHADPKIENAVAAIQAEGVDQIVGLVLAPHNSAFSVGQYLDRMVAAAGLLPTAGVRSWATEPAFVEFVAADLERRIASMGGRPLVLFTAHSLPERILSTGDPYPDQLRATAQAVADSLGLTEGRDWQIAWQSAGRTPEPWIGPDIRDVIATVGATGDHDGVIVSAVGFVADHLEVLYDLDVEARGVAEQYGLRFDRTTCVNADPAVMGALAELIDSAAQRRDIR